MFGRFRQLLPATAWVIGIASAWADTAHLPQTGYLPQAGPLPLRFRALPPPVNEENAEPAPPPPDPRILLPSPPMPATPTNNAVIQAVTNGPAVEFNAREPIPSAMSTNAPEPVISPQMLIKFFMGPTNAVANTNTSASAPGANGPVGFTSPLGTTPPPVSGKASFPIPP